MNIEKLTVAVAVERLQLEEQQTGLLKHDFHEFIYFEKGSGVYCYEQVNTTFSAGDLFLVNKGNVHSLRIEEPSVVYSVKFAEKTRLKLKEMSGSLKEIAGPPVKTKSPVNAKVSFSEEDRPLADRLFEFLLLLGEDHVKNESQILLQMITLVTLTERNLSFAPSLNDVPRNRELIRSILKHISRNLRDPEKLTLARIADEFKMSTNKLGAYFRQETGHTVKQFISSSRMTVIGDRVANSELSFSEIAFEYGFVDESHLNKMFKKHFGKTPTEYRREKNENTKTS
ncbi:AraC family transcriptional regulator [Mangrovibacterium diazotrophicum]|uniref:AraC-like DNA-binding protein n=1 Tax=Mangrovibacterium diazotrophicum TaxID=1261403 RepID=A0A419VW24_9BACT|nr:AraC family transcriptional regulator [Mangrovibacterium diazotrophicum]RKD86369.1 AraC-like DNA-binding protein [Mangrovibacterium diazotrophicum]